MQNNVISFRTKKEISPTSLQAERSAGLQKRQLKREIISAFYEIELSITQAPQNEYSENAREGLISLINYFKHI